MRIYLAGPLFSTSELQWNAILAQFLRRRGNDVYLPQESEGIFMTNAEIFKLDVVGIDQSNVVVANLDGSDPDSGTCWELGYAYAKGKPTYWYRTDWRGDGKVNLMMSESSSCIWNQKTPRSAIDIEELAQAIHEKIRQ